MPEGPDGKTIIIVKKVSGHAGHHGGAWKVAYADFITAMMALFMVLWLVNSASVPTRERIASYFRKPGVFQKGSGTPLEIGGAGILPDTFAPPADSNSQLQLDKRIYESEAMFGVVRDSIDAEGREGGAGSGESREQQLERVEALVEQIREAMAAVGEASLLGEIEIKVDQRGLLIEIMDTEKASMFRVGSAAIMDDARVQLLRIAAILKELPNPVDIEGHTDGRPFRGAIAGRYDNWDLSTDRANAARRVLLEAGMPVQKIARVVGYSDQRLKTVDDPNHASNRRITIAMRFTEQAKAALDGTRAAETQPRPLPLGAAHESSAQEKPGGGGDAGQPKPPLRPEGGLKVEVGTRLPEGPPAAAAPEPPPPPRRIEGDRIFDADNPFFR